MKNKVIALLLCASMTVSLASCASGSSQSQQKSSYEAAAEVLSDSQNTYGTVFGQGSIINVNVQISADDWQTLRDNAEEEEYYSADITVNGTMLKNVGFRAKGFSSLTSVARSDSDRYGFKVKTDEYVKGQTLNGLDMLVLNGSFADPSYMREYMTYLAAAYLNGTTPYVTYANLSINGDLFGFYLMIEAYDDSFVARYSTGDDTVLYKADSENCTLLTDDDASGFDVKYGEDAGNSNIQKLIAVLNNTTEENKADLESILDVNSALKAWAINTVMGNYDSYSGSKAHNYYLLYTGGKFSYIGWDYNMSIGGFSEDNGASVEVDVLNPAYSTEMAKRPLIQKLLAISEYKERYLGYV